MEIRNLSDAEFKTLIIMILEELSKDFNRIKKKALAGVAQWLNASL